LEERFDEAIDLYYRTLTDQELTLGPDHPDVLSTRYDLARAFLLVERFTEAIALYHHVLSVKEGILGPDHPDLLFIRHILAGAYQAAGRLYEATALYRQILTVQKRILGPRHPYTRATQRTLNALKKATTRPLKWRWFGLRDAPRTVVSCTPNHDTATKASSSGSSGQS